MARIFFWLTLCVCFVALTGCSDVSKRGVSSTASRQHEYPPKPDAVKRRDRLLDIRAAAPTGIRVTSLPQTTVAASAVQLIASVSYSNGPTSDSTVGLTGRQAEQVA